VTIAGSTYMILYGEKLYRFLKKPLSIFERAKNKERELSAGSAAYETILFGCNRIGYDFVDTLQKAGREFLVVDYDPQTIAHLRRRGISCEYGDMSDIEFLQELRFETAKMVISTIPDFESSLVLLKEIRLVNPQAIVILTAHDIDEARVLYDRGRPTLSCLIFSVRHMLPKCFLRTDLRTTVTRGRSPSTWRILILSRRWGTSIQSLKDIISNKFSNSNF
jgi:hypothetical protein